MNAIRLDSARASLAEVSEGRNNCNYKEIVIK